MEKKMFLFLILMITILFLISCTAIRKSGMAGDDDIQPSPSPAESGPICGNNKIEAGEQCDGWNVGEHEANCVYYIDPNGNDYIGGTVTCNQDCEYAKDQDGFLIGCEYLEPDCFTNDDCSDLSITTLNCSGNYSVQTNTTYYICEGGECMPTDPILSDEPCINGTICVGGACINTNTTTNTSNTTTALGTLNINTDPSGAKLYVDDVYKGKTPKSLTLETGNKIVRVYNSSYREAYSAVTIEEDVTKTLTIPLVLLNESFSSAGCFDSDNGTNINITGRTYGYASGYYSNKWMDVEDSCMSNPQEVREYYCTNGLVSHGNYGCSDERQICRKGACV